MNKITVEFKIELDDGMWGIKQALKDGFTHKHIKESILDDLYFLFEGKVLWKLDRDTQWQKW